MGILFATHMLLPALRRSLSVLRDLPGDDRVAVIRAVRRGGSVHDWRSAEALIAYAGALRHEYEATDRCQGLFGLMAVLSITVVILELVLQGTAVNAIGKVVLAIAWAIPEAGWPWWRERAADRMDSAVASAQRLLDSQRGPTGQGSRDCPLP